MKKIRKYYVLLCMGLILFFGQFFSNFVLPTTLHTSTYAQSSIDSIKAKIKTVVAGANGKISLATKIRLLELISAKIKTSSNPVIIDIYVFFLKEVREMRTSDEILTVSTPTGTTPQPIQNTTTSVSGPDFNILFASAVGGVSLNQQFATISIKIKNNGLDYSPDSFGSLKFGCKGEDGNLYPYWSYQETQIIANNQELTLEIPSVFIGNLTNTQGFKLLSCKIDSSDLIKESNEDNNFINVSVQVY